MAISETRKDRMLQNQPFKRASSSADEPDGSFIRLYDPASHTWDPLSHLKESLVKFMLPTLDVLVAASLIHLNRRRLHKSILDQGAIYSIDISTRQEA